MYIVLENYMSNTGGALQYIYCILQTHDSIVQSEVTDKGWSAKLPADVPFCLYQSFESINYFQHNCFEKVSFTRLLKLLWG